jgi:chemotaxis signal transduction protein/nucleoid-associated protein YgaU
MRELFLATFNGVSYGIWKDEILSVRGLDALHRIPLTPACIAGIMMEDGRSVTLADLPVCIGYDSTRKTEPGCILLKEGENRTLGFVVSGELRTLAVAPELIFPLPDYLCTAVFDSCAVHDGVPIPLINITELHDRVLNRDDDLTDTALQLPSARQQDVSAMENVRIFSCGGERYAISAEGVEDMAADPGSVTPLPGTPRYVRGVSFCNGRLLTVIDLSQRLIRRGGPITSKMLVAKFADSEFGFLVDSDAGNCPVGEVSFKPAPAIVQTPWLKHVLLRNDELIPLIDLAMTLSPGADERPVWQRYAPDSIFPEHFFRQAVDVTVFTILGEHYALPRVEVEDVIPFQSCRALPDAPDIVVGITQHGGEVLPVLDLAMMFGRRSLATPAWRMMLVSNGDFRALVVTETVAGEKHLPPDVHRAMPIHLPHRLMYGCYPDGIAARVILNVEAIAVHFDRSLIQRFMPTLSEQMKASPTGAVYTFPDEKVIAEMPQQVAASPAFIDEPDVAEVSAADSIQMQASNVPLDVVAAEQDHTATAAPDVREAQETAITLPAEAEPQDFPAGIASELDTQVSAASDASSFNSPSPHDIAAAQAESLPDENAAPSAIDERRMPEPIVASTNHAINSQRHNEAEQPAMQTVRVNERSGGTSSLRYGLAAFAAMIAAALLYVAMSPKQQDAAKQTATELHKSDTVVSAPARGEPVSTRTPIVPPLAAAKAAEPLVLEVPANMPVEAELYVVKKGDTLWNISQRLTGNPYNYPRLAGSNAIANPDLIFSGQRIRLIKRD